LTVVGKVIFLLEKLLSNQIYSN